MSDTPGHDLLAAEYVLGTLEGDEAKEAARLLESDAAFAAAVHAWEERLVPLAAAAPPVAPVSSLWDRIAVSTGAAPGDVVPLALHRRLRAWRVGTGIALVIAASLAAFIVVRQPPPPRVAVLMPLTGSVPVLLATAGPGGALEIRADGAIAVPEGRDLELWALGAGDTRPRSLGILPASGRRLTAALGPDTQLLVSLEPRGGSPTGAPTGPVLYGGRLATLN